MSREMDNLRQKFAGRLSAAGMSSFYGTVEAIDEEMRTCTVRIGGVVRSGVLLYLLHDPERKEPPKKGWWFVPKKESTVLVTKVDGAGTRLRVEMFSEIEKVMLTMGDESVGETALEFSITKDGGYKLNRGGSGLRKTLTDLCSAIEKLTVTTAMGPSGTPTNAAAFTKIKQELNDYLEG